jgi:primosomal protein N'
VEKETQKVFDLLQKFADNDNNIIDINEPYEPLIAKKRGYYYKNILIKTKREAEIQKISIFPILSKLKKGWGIDLDPVSTV